MLGTGGGNRSQKSCGQISKPHESELNFQTPQLSAHVGLRRARLSLPSGGRQQGPAPPRDPQADGRGGVGVTVAGVTARWAPPFQLASPAPALASRLCWALRPTIPCPPGGLQALLVFPDLSPPPAPCLASVPLPGHPPPHRVLGVRTSSGSSGSRVAQTPAGDQEGRRLWGRPGPAWMTALPTRPLTVGVGPATCRRRHWEQIPAQAGGAAGGVGPHTLSQGGDPRPAP